MNNQAINELEQLQEENKHLRKLVLMLVEAHKQNANEDFRGGRSSASVRSFNMLQKYYHAEAQQEIKSAIKNIEKGLNKELK